MIQRVLARVPRVKYSVSHTTREARPGEIDGEHYFFVTEEEFRKRIDDDGFLEYATVHGNLYGTSKSFLEQSTEAGYDVILEIDVQGAAQIDSKGLDTTSIFIMPPSFDELKRRLTERGTENAGDLAVRLRNSLDETEQYSNFDYVVLNDELEKAAKDLEGLILALRLETGRQEDSIQDILTTFEKKSEVNN